MNPICSTNTPSGKKIINDKAGFFLDIKNGKIDKKNIIAKIILLNKIFFVILLEKLLIKKNNPSFLKKKSLRVNELLLYKYKYLFQSPPTLYLNAQKKKIIKKSIRKNIYLYLELASNK